MSATISHYPRVTEWIYIGDTAINMAQVTSIEFAHSSGDEYAIVLPCSPDVQYEVHDAALVRYLRDYVEQMLAPRRAPGARR